MSEKTACWSCESPPMPTSTDPRTVPSLARCARNVVPAAPRFGLNQPMLDRKPSPAWMSASFAWERNGRTPLVAAREMPFGAMKKPVVPPLVGRRSLKTRTPVVCSLEVPILSAPSPVVENCDPTTSLMTSSAPGATATPRAAEAAESPVGELGKEFQRDRFRLGRTVHDADVGHKARVVQAVHSSDDREVVNLAIGREGQLAANRAAREVRRCGR